MYRSFLHHIIQPMQAHGMKLNLIFAKSPNLLNSFSRFHNHPLIRKHSHMQFNNE